MARSPFTHLGRYVMYQNLRLGVEIVYLSGVGAMEDLKQLIQPPRCIAGMTANSLDGIERRMPMR